MMTPAEQGVNKERFPLESVPLVASNVSISVSVTIVNAAFAKQGNLGVVEHEVCQAGFCETSLDIWKPLFFCSREVLLCRIMHQSNAVTFWIVGDQSSAHG